MTLHQLIRRGTSASIVGILAVIAVACGQNKYEERTASPPAPPDIAQSLPPVQDQEQDRDKQAPATVPANAPEPAQPIERQIIRTGNLSLKVQTLDSTEAAITRIAATNGGYIANSSRTQISGSSRMGTLQIRIPAAKFEAVFAALRSLGEVTQEDVGSNDVTQEYIDLEARLRTQKELEGRLLTLLKEKSGKLEELIAVEEKLAAVRSQIETLQGQLRFMQNQISMSTITISLYEPGAVGASGETFGGRIERAINDGIDGLVELIGVAITAIIALLPVIAGILLLYIFVFRPLRRRAQARRRERETRDGGRVTPT